MKKKLQPLSSEEHKHVAKDLRKAQEILEPMMEKIYKSYGVNSKESKQLHTVLNLLSSKMCASLDNRWYQLSRIEIEGHSSPYYGSGKVAWI